MMPERFISWGVEFAECALPEQAATLVDDFKAKDPERYFQRMGAWQCPFLTDAVIVGLYRTGIIGGIGGPYAFVVTRDAMYPMHDFIGTIAEKGSPLFCGSDQAILSYVALLLDYLPGEGDVIMIQPRDVKALNESGIETDSLFEAKREGNVFAVLAYVLDVESIVSRLTLQINSSNGEVVSFNLETTGIESVARRGFM